eukprot:6765251-Karenia_brevis.AAC.1
MHQVDQQMKIESQEKLAWEKQQCEDSEFDIDLELSVNQAILENSEDEMRDLLSHHASDGLSLD